MVVGRVENQFITSQGELRDTLQRETAENPLTLVCRVGCRVDGPHGPYDAVLPVAELPTEEGAVADNFSFVERDPRGRSPKRAGTVLPVKERLVRVSGHPAVSGRQQADDPGIVVIAGCTHLEVRAILRAGGHGQFTSSQDWSIRTVHRA